MRQDHDRHARANECLRKSRDLLEQLRESQVQTAKFVAEARAELNGTRSSSASVSRRQTSSGWSVLHGADWFMPVRTSKLRPCPLD